MVVRLTKFERIAGVMMGGVLVGSLAITLGIALKKGWFEDWVDLRVVLNQADGLHSGTPVLLSGLRVGEVTAIDLAKDNSIEITFVVKEKFFERIRQDSVVQVVRPFIIGDKVLDLSVGSLTSQAVKQGDVLRAVETTDLMDLLSGRKLGPALDSLQGLAVNLKNLAEAFADPRRVDALVRAFDTLNPLFVKLDVMAKDISLLTRQMTQDEALKKTIEGLQVTTREINQILPAINEDSPRLGQDVAALARNLALLSEEFKKIVPALQAVAPELPHASRQAVTALDEMVITLKAMQESFLLSDQAEKIRREMQSRQTVPKVETPPAPRRPASEGDGHE